MSEPVPNTLTHEQAQWMQEASDNLRDARLAWWAALNQIFTEGKMIHWGMNGHRQTGHIVLITGFAGCDNPGLRVQNARTGKVYEISPVQVLFPEHADTRAADALLELMTDISEDHYSAGWMDGLEYSLWRGVIYQRSGMPYWYGIAPINPARLEQLDKLSQAAGGWWAWDGSEVFVSMEDWLQRFKREYGESST